MPKPAFQAFLRTFYSRRLFFFLGQSVWGVLNDPSYLSRQFTFVMAAASQRQLPMQSNGYKTHLVLLLSLSLPSLVVLSVFVSHIIPDTVVGGGKNCN